LNLTYQRIHAAWRAFRSGKQLSPAIDDFSYHLTANLLDLTHQLNIGTYRHSAYRQISVQEKKRRDISVAAVRDRVVHRLIYDELVRIFDDSFDYDVWSCRIDKGLHKCLDRTKNLLGRYQRAYVWRMDIAKFYDHVDHAVLMKCSRRRLDDQQLLWLCEEIINSFSLADDRPRGIPIGNLTSQVFSNIYLNEFDRWARHQSGALAYVRYGDDCVIFAPTRQVARELRRDATLFLHENLRLDVNPKNDVIVRSGDGLDFLGHHITSAEIIVDRHTTVAALSSVNYRNLASYKSLKFDNRIKRRFDHQVLDEITEVIGPKY
jgi:retron-type reverse transcriptase